MNIIDFKSLNIIMATMKRFIIALLCVTSVLFLSCDTIDSPNSLPYVETEKFKTETGFIFPEETTALEFYKTLEKKYGQGRHSVTGTYIHTESAVLNGKTYSDTITKDIKSINIYKSDTEISHLFHIDFLFENGTCLKFYYQWQYHNTNVWHNNKSDGEITISFTV